MTSVASRGLPLDLNEIVLVIRVRFETTLKNFFSIIFLAFPEELVSEQSEGSDSDEDIILLNLSHFHNIF